MSSAAPSAVRQDNRDLPASAPPKRKPAKRTARHFVEEPLYLLPSHYALLQDSTFELLRGLANLSSAVEDDPLYFDQLLGAAVNIKHAFDLGRMDVINGTIRPRNTSLCHECITTVSSVWRSGPDGPRSLCNACGLRYYKQNQRRALEAKRRETKDAADAAASLAALSGVPIDVARRILSRKDVDLSGVLKPQDDEEENEEDEEQEEDEEEEEEDTGAGAEVGDAPRLAPPAARLSIANLCQPLDTGEQPEEEEPVTAVSVASLKHILTLTRTVQRDAAAAEYADAAQYPPALTDPSHSSSYCAGSNHH
ncbi:hypothetical protein FB645_000322 [Coemansia sp. IMI 203386]|nr:hypothetical protein FB645_000322 [Coemansia sp. IMI 203386]